MTRGLPAAARACRGRRLGLAALAAALLFAAAGCGNGTDAPQKRTEPLPQKRTPK